MIRKLYEMPARSNKIMRNKKTIGADIQQRFDYIQVDFDNVESLMNGLSLDALDTLPPQAKEDLLKALYDADSALGNAESALDEAKDLLDEQY